MLEEKSTMNAHTTINMKLEGIKAPVSRNGNKYGIDGDKMRDFIDKCNDDIDALINKNIEEMIAKLTACAEAE